MEKEKKPTMKIVIGIAVTCFIISIVSGIIIYGGFV
jgi:hypothetical protein